MIRPDLLTEPFEHALVATQVDRDDPRRGEVGGPVGQPLVMVRLDVQFFFVDLYCRKTPSAAAGPSARPAASNTVAAAPGPVGNVRPRCPAA